MDCSKELHDGFIESGVINCPFCYKELEQLSFATTVILSYDF